MKSLRTTLEQAKRLFESFKKHFMKMLQKFIALRYGRQKLFYTILGSSAATILITSAGIAVGISRTGDDFPPVLVTTGNDAQSAPRIINPEFSSDSSFLLIPGTVLSNETANIYPRREGIVEDVYFDIGDKVKKGEVVAILLPKGVEGQSVAAIAEKSAKKAQAESDHINARRVAVESINKAGQQIEEAKTLLEVARSEQESIVKKMAQSAVNATQMREQAFISVRDARQVMERILTGTNSNTGIDLKEEDILRQIGALSSNKQERYDILLFFNTFKNYEYAYLDVPDSGKDAALEKLFAKAKESFFALHELMAATGSVPIPQPGRGTEMDTVEITKEVLSVQDKILKAEEKWQDALLSYEELAASEPELHKSMLGEKSDVKSNKVKLLESQLKTVKNNYGLIESQQQQMIERSEKSIQIANATLRAESAQSGNRNVLSPFSGVISKRFIDVGEVVMPSRPAFELVDVPTSLSKRAKTEVQFGLPEHLVSSVNIGSTIEFLLPGNEKKSYEAVVSRKSPQVDMETHTITVQAKISDEISLPNHSNVRVRIAEHGEPVYRVPSYSVKRESEENMVWILDKETNKPMQIRVSVIAEDGEFAEISGEISAETEIILDPPDLFPTKSP